MSPTLDLTAQLDRTIAQNPTPCSFVQNRRSRDNTSLLL